MQQIRIRRLYVRARMADAEEGTAAPNQRQGQNWQQNQQQQNQDAAGQWHLHINWFNFKPEFSGK